MSDEQSNYGILCLKSKDVKSALIQKLSTDFNLTPIIAEAYYKQNNQRLIDLLTLTKPGVDGEKNLIMSKYQEKVNMTKPYNKTQIQLKKMRR